MAKSLRIQKQEWPLVLGVDIGSTSVKYFLIRRQAGKIRSLRFGKHQISDNFGASDFSAIVQNLFKNNRSFRKAMVVIGVDGPNLVIKREILPALSKKELAQAVLFSVQNDMGKEFGTLPLIVDYQQLAKKDDGIEYVLIGMSVEGVESKIKPFLTEGVVPVKVMPNALALKRLLDFLPSAQAEKGVIGFLDVGVSMSTLLILKDRETDYFREIKVGGDDFSKAISGTIFHEGRAVQLTPDETMEFKQMYGYPMGYTEGMMYKGAPLTEIGAMMRPVVERFTGEVQRSLDFYRDKSQGVKVERLYLVGGGSRLKHLSDALKEKIDIPVNAFPMPSVRMSGGRVQQEAFEKHFLEQAVSFALALDTTTDCNLLPAALKNTHRMKHIQTILQWILGGILAILIVITGGLHQSNLVRKNDMSQLETRAAFIQSRAAAYQMILAKQAGMEARINAVRRESGRDETVSDLLKLFSHVVTDKISLLTLEFGEQVEQQPQDRRPKESSAPASGWAVKVKGFNPHPSSDIRIHVAKLIMELEKSGYFSNLNCTQEVMDEKTNEYMFELTGTLQKGPVMNPKKNPWYVLPALMAVVNVLWIMLMFLPMRMESGQLSVRMNELRMKTTQEIPEPEIRKGQAKIDSLSGVITTIEQRLYPESELLKLGGVLETVGSRYGLTLKSVSPQYDSLTVVVNSKEPINELPLKIEYEGRFGDLSRFLDNAAEFPFILKMSGISIKKANPSNPVLSIQLAGGIVIKKERGGQP